MSGLLAVAAMVLWSWMPMIRGRIPAVLAQMAFVALVYASGVLMGAAG